VSYRTYELGPLTVILPSKSNLDQKVLESSGKMRITKCSENDFGAEQINYYLKDYDSGNLVSILGYSKDKKSFKIQRIENNTANRQGFRNLSKLLKAIEGNLREEGYEEITARPLYRIALIAIKKYGFEFVGNKTYEELKNSWTRKIPYFTIKLRKSL
jgi:hypothetical protein